MGRFYTLIKVATVVEKVGVAVTGGITGGIAGVINGLAGIQSSKVLGEIIEHVIPNLYNGLHTKHDYYKMSANISQETKNIVDSKIDVEELE